MRRGGLALAVESANVARVWPVVSLLILILSLSAPLATLVLVGRNIEDEAALLAKVDDAGARVVTVLSTGNAPAIPASAVDRIARLGGIDWVVGLGQVSDVRIPATGKLAPARTIYAIRGPVTFSGRGLGAFLSQASATRLGLQGAYGEIQPGGASVVGWFEADYPLQELNSFVLVPSPGGDSALSRVIVSVHDVEWVDAVARELPAMLGQSADRQTTVQSSEQLLAARAAIGSEASRRDRELVVALLFGEIGLGSLVVFAGALSSRRDFGRRRALGASRRQLVSLVVMSTLWPAILGAALGALAGSAYLAVALGSVPAWRFPCSLAVLTVMCMTASAVPPAAFAATRDPLRVLRVP